MLLKLAAASKALENIVSKQITKHMETNKLLPKSQHGFREKRSTVTVFSEIQRDWIENMVEEKVTGVSLIWQIKL